MGIKFNCKHCQTALNVKQKLAGKTALCPRCKNPITIPSSPNEKRKPVAAVTSDSTLVEANLFAESPEKMQPTEKEIAPNPPESPQQEKTTLAFKKNPDANESRKPPQRSSQTPPPIRPEALTLKENRLAGTKQEVPAKGIQLAQPAEKGRQDAGVFSLNGPGEPADGPSSPSIPNLPASKIESSESKTTKSSLDQNLPPVLPVQSDSPDREDVLASAPDAVWYLRPPGGGQFGPASVELMRQWIREGRIGSHSLVWREGWADWMVAKQVFPQLSKSGSDSNIAVAVPIDQVTRPTSGPLDPAAANEKKLRYYRKRKRAAAWGIVAILIGLMTIAALAVLLAIVLSNNS